MGRRGHKAAKLMISEDQMNKLPDEILSRIVSLLPLKEAARTSILSKRWRHIWTSHSELWFDAASILGMDNCSTFTSGNQPSGLNSRMQSSMFVEWVDRIMYHRSQGPKINSLSIHFPLGKEFTSNIDQWISCAVMKGAENIDLDLKHSGFIRRDCTSSKASQIYEFPSWPFSGPGRRCTLKHLRLASCRLGALPSSDTLSSLITLDLQRVDISDQQLQDLLSNCSYLEQLSLSTCNGLVKLKISAPKLKVLSIKNCFRLETVEINAADLVTIKYGGHLPSFSFKNVPKLAKAHLDFAIKGRRTEGVFYALTRIPSILPQLNTLNLRSVLTLKKLELPQLGPKFSNIKQLELTVFPFNDDDNFGWIGYIMKAFPLLQKLELNLFSPSFTNQAKEVERCLPECPHKHLSKLQINGFYGHPHEVDLLKYLLHNSLALEHLVIAPTKKHGEYTPWVSKVDRLWCKARLPEVSKWLLEVLPRTVRLEIGDFFGVQS